MIRIKMYPRRHIILFTSGSNPIFCLVSVLLDFWIRLYEWCLYRFAIMIKALYKVFLSKKVKDLIFKAENLNSTWSTSTIRLNAFIRGKLIYHKVDEWIRAEENSAKGGVPMRDFIFVLLYRTFKEFRGNFHRFVELDIWTT